MARPPGSHDIASTIRGAFLRAAKMSEEDGRPLSLIILEQLTESPLDCLNTISKFVPKEMLIEATVVEELDKLSDEAIAIEVERLARESAPLLAAARASEKTAH